jgi:hypothetical protein
MLRTGAGPWSALSCTPDICMLFAEGFATFAESAHSFAEMTEFMGNT